MVKIFHLKAITSNASCGRTGPFGNQTTHKFIANLETLYCQKELLTIILRNIVA